VKAERSSLITRTGLLRGGLFVVILMVAPLILSAQWQVNLLVFSVLYAAMAVAWNLIGGYARYPSLGHAAFFGVGAYSIALLFKGSQPLANGYQPFFMLPAIGIAVAVIVVPIGMIAMRVRTDVFAIVTITVLFVAQSLAFNLKGVTGGSQGAAVAVPPFAPDTFDQPFYYAGATLLLISMALSYMTTRTKIGLALTAIRADEDKARAIGVWTSGVKLLAFCVSAGLTAMAGGIWAYYIGFIYPQFAIDPLVTVSVVLMAFLGGRATLWGPVLGAFILMPSQQLLAYYVGGAQYYLIAYAAVFLVIMLLLPRGIVPTVQHWLRRSDLAARRDGLPGEQAEPARIPGGGGAAGEFSS
jgi:branched-chain amino acid transport system permease protein